MERKSRHALLHDLLEVVLLHQLVQEPEGTDFSCMIQQNGSDIVHTLHIAYGGLIVRVRQENALDAVLGALLLEVLHVLERAIHVALYFRLYILQFLRFHLR